MPRNVLIEFRRDTAANWTSADPTLASGEPGYETDTGKIKIGDGSTAWTSLPYYSGPANTLAEVLAAGNDAGGTLLQGVPEVHAGAVASTSGESITLYGSDNAAGSGGGAALQGGPGTDGGAGASVLAAGADAGPVDGLLYVTTGGSNGDIGNVLVNVDGFGGLGWQAVTGTINFVVDGGGSTVTTGIKGDVVMPFAGEFTQVTLLADQSGSIEIDIWNQVYGSYPPTVTESIVAAAPPTITTAIKSQDSTLSGWTTAFAAGDILRFSVSSVTSITRATLALDYTKQ